MEWDRSLAVHIVLSLLASTVKVGCVSGGEDSPDGATEGESTETSSGTDEGETSTGEATGIENAVECSGVMYAEGKVLDSGTEGLVVGSQEGLAALEGIACIRGEGLEIHSVRDLLSLTSMERVEGSFILSQNDDLVTLDGLENLTHVGVVLTLDQNPSLENVEALAELRSVSLLRVGVSGPQVGEGPTESHGNDGLVKMVSLSKLESLDSISFADNDRLKNLGAPPSIENVDFVSFENNPSLSYSEAIDWAEAFADPGSVASCGSDGDPQVVCESSAPGSP